MLMYGFQPRSPISVGMKNLRVQAAADFLADMQEMLQLAKDSIRSAQDRARHYADLSRKHKTFMVNDWVFLRVPSHSRGLKTIKCAKLAPRYCGPFKVIQVINKVAYKLDLPANVGIHPVFHVSKLKPSLGVGETLVPVEDLVELLRDESVSGPPEPEAIVNSRQRTLRSRVLREFLVRWRGKSEEEDTWEKEADLQKNFPNFFLQGKI
ncbi:hypothetical protein O6H91_06G109200 [Diphasiastrum complanatum]|uniref:Uncharacterized protein n=1 Tax=Diphasiastrum complanatum TaxID=34168 RepID=A0ACC2DHA6_DIPCM|nr:hypothetical protein O6H91_06G109200 [Diphasiastrum complanatum]